MLPSLDPIREAVGAPKRKARLFKNCPLEYPAPDWVNETKEKDNPAVGLYYEQKWLWKKGIVRWGCLLKANNQLFEPCDKTLPGEILFSPTESDDDAYQSLITHHERLWQLTEDGAQPKSDREKDWAEDMADDFCFHRGYFLPEEWFDEGVEYRATTAIFYPDFLPEKKLKYRIFPVLVYDGMPWTIAPVPYSFWPEGFEDQLIRTRDEQDDVGNYRKLIYKNLGEPHNRQHENRSQGPPVELSHFLPSADREFHTWVTIGMSAQSQPHVEEDVSRFELIFYAKKAFPEAMNLIRAYSAYPWQLGAPIFPGDTVPINEFAETMLGSDRFPVLLFAGGVRPQDRELAGTIDVGGKPVYPMMIVPLTQKEFEFYRENGAQEWNQLVSESSESILFDCDRKCLIDAANQSA